MRIVIDTGVLWRPAALRALAEMPHDIVVPAVVFVERARQVARDGRRPDELLELFEANDMEVEPFGVEQALRYAVDLHDDDAWKRLARDAMIAGHLAGDDMLWTTNPRDFLEAGVERERIVAVP